MSKVVIQPNLVLDAEQILNGMTKMAINEFEHLFEQILALRARRIVPTISQEEGELLLKINEGVPDEVRLRFRLLREKMWGEVITQEEHEELIDLTDQIETSDVDRLQNLLKLAQLRNVSLDTVMGQLDLRKPTYA
ncbi:MAG: hypothetical protein AAF639_26595 [Chloroflexota bacterium]